MSYFITGLVCFLLGGGVAEFARNWFDYESILTDFFAGVALVVLFIPLTIYNIFFKLTLVHRPTQEQVDLALNTCERERHYHLCGKLFLHFDPEATKMWNKVFLLRIK